MLEILIAILLIGLVDRDLIPKPQNNEHCPPNMGRERDIFGANSCCTLTKWGECCWNKCEQPETPSDQYLKPFLADSHWVFDTNTAAYVAQQAKGKVN